MENKRFKKIFGQIAQENGFEFQYGGWFRETNLCIITLDLQKSNYSNLYYLNVKVYIHGTLGIKYSRNKGLIKDVGDVFRRQPLIYDPAFDLENQLTEKERVQLVKKLFDNFLLPMVAQLEDLKSMKNYFLLEKLPLCQPVKDLLDIK